MRLIDKDVLLAEVRKKFYTPSSIKLIEKQEEVKAITVEWINDWLNTGRNAKYFITIMKMLEDWEKENETN